MGVSVWPVRPELTNLGSQGIAPAAMFRPGGAKRKAEKAPKDWREWLTTMFPTHFNRPLATRHVEFWQWVLSVKLDEPSDPFVAIWPRGGGKSASAEGAVVAVGVRGRRKYVLYVRETQKQADESVANIAGLLELATIERFYPEHAKPLLSKFGDQRAWRRNRLRTAGGFTVDALGLDTASRGSKVDANRPDLIVLDDIDAKHDSPTATKKKEEIITHTILPTMATKSGTVLGIQNLIIRDGIFSQLSDGRADFLSNRKVSGPFPAIEGLKYEWREDPKTGRRKAFIVAGVPTWEGQSIADCQHLLSTIGLSAFLKEGQQKVKGKVEGVALRFEESRHLVDIPHAEAVKLCAMGRVFGGVDFGAWRFAFTLWAVDRNGIPHRIDEVFSQWDGLTNRAQIIHECCAFYGVEKCILWGDAANPQDIMELNLAFRRGWDVEEEDEATGDRSIRHVTSKLRCVKVAQENKLRKAGVTRMNDALDMNTIRFRRIEPYDWMLGMNAGAEGTPQSGSRLIWEIENWAFPVPVPGKAQDENPDDHTADGADMMASARYALMSWWTKAKMPKEYPVISDDRARPFDMKRRQFKDHPHALDDFLDLNSGRRTPRVTVPRPRVGR